MNITKRDIRELSRRMKKKDDCSFSLMCGCYVNSGKQIVTKFGVPFSELSEDEFFKYLEIARKTVSGALGSNILELSFDEEEVSAEKRQFLYSLKESRLKTEELIDAFYDKVIAEYSNTGNYLILLYHDVYDIPRKARDGIGLDESEETYEYVLCAICPVDLSKPTLGYRENENRIGACERDWVVGMPELGFVYPAFIHRGSDVNAVMYYVKTGKGSHPEFIENVLGCVPQRTAAENKQVFEDIVTGAFGEDDKKGESAFMLLQNTIGGIVEELKEDETLPQVSLTSEVVCDLAADAYIPEDVRERIEKACSEVFGDEPPYVTSLFDAKLAEKGAQRANTIRLEKKIEALSQQLSEREGEQETKVSEPSEEVPEDVGGEEGIVLRVPEYKAEKVRTEAIDGQRYLLIPIDEGENASVNGKPVQGVPQIN